MKILHVVPGLAQNGNGIAVAAKFLAKDQSAALVETVDFACGQGDVRAYDEVWVHSNWRPETLRACVRVVRAGVPLVRMPHGNLDPVRLAFHGWRKALVAPLERWLYRHTARIVVTCAAERAWCEAWGVKGPFEICDLRRFFRLDVPVVACRQKETLPPLHVFYLGREHPLKGIVHLRRAVACLNEGCPPSMESGQRRVDLRIASDVIGAEKEAAWGWCDVLCLPTLSDNFGLVVAEALEHGKPVITTDGAPAWKDEPRTDVHGHTRLVYLEGFRDGTDARRVQLLRQAIESFLRT